MARSASSPRTTTLSDASAFPAEPPASIEAAEALTFAWTLKDACYAAWSSEPRRAAEAAERLAAWHARLLVAQPAGDWREVGALAAWTHGIAELTRGQMAGAVTALDEAAALFAGIGQAGSAAQTQVPKIVALAMLDRHADAVASAEATQAAFVAQGDTRSAAKVSLNLGSLQLRHDAYVSAARHYREAARLFARVGDSEHSVMADIGLADALATLGELDEAERSFARARVRAEAHALPVLQALAEGQQALLDLSRGRFGAALAGFERSRAGYEALDMPQHLAIAEKMLADAYLELRLLPEAERLYAQALQIFDKLDMPHDTAWALTQRGRGQALRGQLDEAGASFSAAAALFQAEDNVAGQAAVALAQAELALARNDAPAALRSARQAAAAYAQAESEDGMVRAALTEAQALLLDGHAAEAHAAFGSTLANARERRRLGSELRSLVGQAQAAQALGNHAAARQGFEAAVARFEELQEALPADELRSAFLADHLRPYRELLGYALADHAKSPTPTNAATVLRMNDRLRARTLSERLAVGPEEEAAADEATATLRARVSWLARRAAGLEAEDSTPSAALRQELQQGEQTLLERLRRHRLTGSITPSESTAARLDLDSLTAALGADEVVLEYGWHGEELFACIVRASGVTLHRHLAAWPVVLAAVRAARFQLQSLGQGATVLQSHLPMLAARCDRRLQQLYALVWAPLADALGDTHRVLLVAPPPLGGVPFAALGDGMSVLAERHELAWMPSGAAAAGGLRPQPPGAPRQAFVLGESSRLPHAASEARAVAAAFENASLQLDADATVEALRSKAASEADLLHLACHAQFRVDSPRFSALYLHDGALTAEQVETLRLAARVVVLSGCETAGEATHSDHGDNMQSGDEWIGLVRAFLLAGSARVMASLWPVDDRVTGEFMHGFYRALAMGAAPAGALQQAQRDLRSRHPHPFHWAAFALYGGW